MQTNRTRKSIKNIIFSFGEQISTNLISFGCRTIFIYILGKTYLGFNGLFSDIFTLLSLGELGVGTAITYSMYKPMANNDYKQVSALINLYKRFYNIIGIIIILVGICLIPYLDFFISDIPEIKELKIIYLLYLLNTTCSYFIAYKKSLLVVDQRIYVASAIYTIIVYIQNILQIVELLVFKDFILYLAIMVCCTLMNNICVSVYVDRHYSFLKTFRKEKVDRTTLNSIKSNVFAMFFSKVSSAVVTSTDNLLISKFVSTITLGLYSNYTLFTSMLRVIVSKIFEGLTGSVGNLIATSDRESIYLVTQKIWFANFWIVGFCSAALFVLITPFINLWIGASYTLSLLITGIICFNFYNRFIRQTFLMLIDTYGLFSEIKVKCVFEALINFIVSLIFVEKLKMGIGGVLLGTFVSNITTNFWYEPWIIYVKKFRVSLKNYFICYLKYTSAMLLATALSYIPCYFLEKEIGNWFSFIMEGCICVVIINLVFVCIFHKTEEYSYFKGMVFKLVKINR